MGERRADPAGPSPQLPGRRDAAAGRRRLRPARPPAPPWPGRARPLPAPTRRARPPPAGPGSAGLGRGPCHFPGGPSDMPLAGGRLPAAATRGAVLPAAEARRGAGPATRVIVLRASPPCGWSCVRGVRPRRTVSSCSDQSEVSAGGRWPARLGRPDRAPAAGGPGPDCAGPSPNAPVAPGLESAGCGGRGPFWRRRCCYRLLGRVGGVGVPVYLRPGVHSRERGFP